MTDWLTVLPQDTEEIARYVEAVQTIAGAGKTGYEAISKFFGSSFVNNLKKVFGKAEQLTAAIPEERRSQPSPAIMIPLIESAMKENRDELQTRWAALMANAALDGGHKVRRDFIETLAKLEPVDVLVLDIISKKPVASSPEAANDANRYIDKQRQTYKLQGEEWDVTLQTLLKLGCTIHGFQQLSPFGRLFVAACTVH
jgi:hypothetical protein